MRPLRARPRRTGGFTLVEMLIAVAMLSILTMIATPSYLEYVRRSARADAQLVLQQAANHLERMYAECNSYLVRNAATVPPCTTAMGALPLELRRAPQSGTQRYTVTLPTVTAQTWELRATPADAADGCGTFVLQSNGTRDVTGALGAQRCWRR